MATFKQIYPKTRESVPKLSFLIITFTTLFACFMSSAQQIEIPYGSNPIIDGVLAPTEWNDADFRLIEVMDIWEVQVYYKHSDSSLFFAFYDLKGAFGERYPDVMLDINNDKDTSWKSDDWWFHASYNDCEGKGIYNNWTSCKPSHPGWLANNFPINTPGIIEMEIKYSKIGLPNSSEDTIGISFEVSNTSNDYHSFPFYATIGNPSTWIDGILMKPTSSTPKLEQMNYSVFPNPSSLEVNIYFENPGNEICSMTVLNTFGQIIETFNNIKGEYIKLRCDNWERGLYFFSLKDFNGKSTNGKFFIY